MSLFLLKLLPASDYPRGLALGLPAKSAKTTAHDQKSRKMHDRRPALLKVLHVIDHIGAGGPFRSLLTFASEQRRTGATFEHDVLSLNKNAYAPLIFEARRLGIAVARRPTNEETVRLTGQADVILLHFWNTPHIWEFLTERLQPARYVLWSKILGVHPPQILGESLLAGMASVLLTAGHPDIEHLAPNAQIVPGLANFGRLKDLQPRSHTGVNVDYIGTCNIGKLHPGFVRMLERVDVPGIAVRICGQANQKLSDTIRASRDPDRFRLLGFVEDIATVLSTSDVFAYPLSETTYATSDKSLQEAMLAGIPPVIFPHGGCARFVIDGKTGIVAHSEDEFVRAIEFIWRNPQRREELGRNAKAYALEAFAPEMPAARLSRSILEAVEQPKQNLMTHLSPLRPGDGRVAERFLVSQGWRPNEAVGAVSEWLIGGGEELEHYASSLPDEAYQVEGGVLHWRNAMPETPLLRYWAALWLLRKGRTDEALREVDAARRSGAPDARCAAAESFAKRS